MSLQISPGEETHLDVNKSLVLDRVRSWNEGTAVPADHENDSSVSLQIRTVDERDLLLLFDADAFQRLSETSKR
jgi:hypothetical protein